MFKDEPRYQVWEQLRQHDLRAFQRLLPPAIWREAAARAGVRIVRSALSLPQLVWLGILAAAFTAKSFAGVLSLTVRTLDWAANGRPEALTKARRNARRRQTKRSPHHPRGKDPARVSEEAFVQARQRMPAIFWTMLIELLAERFETEHERLVYWKQFRLLNLDGSTLRLPQYETLAEHFGTAANGKARTVQARMVLLQLPLARLPRRYELCALREGERTVAARLLQHLRPRDLVLMDQGFFSYGLFHQIQDARAFFAIRQYPGLKFKTLRRLGPHDRLVRWKQPTGPRWRGLNLPAAITLRVVDYHIPGFRPSAVVTNVLSPRRISREDWVRMATESEAGRALDRRVRWRVGLYHRRWEIETTFRELKTVQGLERSLRSRTPESIAYEVAGHVVLYLLIRWLMAEAAQAAARDGDPLGLSFKHALEELLTAWPALVTSDPAHVQRHILPRLLQAIASHPVSWRPGRSFPRKKKNTRTTTKRLND